MKRGSRDACSSPQNLRESVSINTILGKNWTDPKTRPEPAQSFGFWTRFSRPELEI